MKWMHILQKSVSGRSVLILFVVTLAVYLIMLLHTIPSVVQQAPELKLFDMSPYGYTTDYAEKLLTGMGPAGREDYLHLQLPIDFVYPGLFAITYTMMLIWLFKKTFDAESKIFLMAFIPAVAGFFDYMENLGVMGMLHSYPTVDPDVVHMASAFSVAKSAFTVAFYLLLLYGLLRFLLKRVRG
ncbi:MAG: hypothetical protein P8Z37_02045 [Acidobacteriota bacterium]